METYGELIKRLRERAEAFDYDGWVETASDYEKAADAIEELSKVVKHQADILHRYGGETGIRQSAEMNDSLLRILQAQSHWIPVTERLPKEGEFVLVYGDLYPNKHDGGVIAVSKRMDWNYWQGFGRERNITHWMPLPEPLKEES